MISLIMFLMDENSTFEGTVMIIYIGPLFATSKFQQVVYCARRGDIQHPTQFPFCF